jgi:predicted Zn-dependent peptidase/LysM repeat protein
MRSWFPYWFTVLSWLALVAFPQDVDARVDSATGAVQRYTLPNGLRVVLNPVPGRSSAAVCVTYLAGSGLEQEGHSGVATLVQQLMTQGSRNVGPNDHARLVTERGGDWHNAVTEEVASYCTEVGSSELPLVFWLEADRMGQPALNKDSFERQRALTFDEHRLTFAHDVRQRGLTRLHELVFQRHWPYEHPSIGFRQDLAAAEYTQAKAFVSDFYAADNAVISVVGTFDEPAVRAWIEQYFAALPGAARKPQRGNSTAPTFARQTSERLSVLEERSLNAPVVFYGWRIPGANTRENRALQIAAYVLGNAQTGRLRNDLLYNESLAAEVECSTYNLRDAGLLRVQVNLHRRSSVDAMQKALEKQLTAMKFVGPSQAELERAKTTLAARRVAANQRVLSRARELGRFEGVYGDPELLDRESEAFASLTVSDVRAAAAKYLLDTRRSIVELYPRGWVRDVGPPVITKTYIVQPGDNLTRIASRYGTTPEQLAKQNGLAVSKRITIGQRLLITTNPSKIVKLVTHTVGKGQTLIAIGKKYGVSAEDLARANGLNTKKAIRPGQVLRIPPKAKTTPPDPKQQASAPATTKGKPQAPPTAQAPSKGESAKAAATGKPPKDTTAPARPQRTYTVKPGDSLSVIAHKFKVSVAELTRANGISKKKPIRPGQKLVIP